jgi:hypothetical protein
MDLSACRHRDLDRELVFLIHLEEGVGSLMEKRRPRLRLGLRLKVERQLLVRLKPKRKSVVEELKTDICFRKDRK